MRPQGIVIILALVIVIVIVLLYVFKHGDNPKSISPGADDAHRVVQH